MIAMPIICSLIARSSFSLFNGSEKGDNATITKLQFEVVEGSWEDKLNKKTRAMLHPLLLEAIDTEELLHRCKTKEFVPLLLREVSGTVTAFRTLANDISRAYFFNGGSFDENNCMRVMYASDALFSTFFVEGHVSVCNGRPKLDVIVAHEFGNNVTSIIQDIIKTIEPGHAYLENICKAVKDFMMEKYREHKRKKLGLS